MPTSGAYTATYLPHTEQNAGSGNLIGPVGLMRAGWELAWEVREHRVDDTTSWGRSLIELIYLGADWHLRAQSVEYAAARLPELAWPYNSVVNPVSQALEVLLENVGSRATLNNAGTLSLLGVGGASQSPVFFVAPYAVAASGSFNFDSRNRESPVSARLLPFSLGQSAAAQADGACNQVVLGSSYNSQAGAADSAAQAAAHVSSNNVGSNAVTQWFITS